MATMSISAMRLYISQHPKYKGNAVWARKCMNMPSRQVVAIYEKFKKLDYEALEADLKAEGAISLPEDYHQINLFEYALDKGIKI